MLTTRLGASAVEVSTIVFGAWAVGGWFWGGTDDDDAEGAILASIDAGVTSIDTAPVYGFGHSESVVGRAIRGRRDQVQILTKCGLVWDRADGVHAFDDVDPHGVARSIYRDLRPDSVRRECDRSLQRLGVDHIDLYQCHWPDPTTPVEDTMGALLDLHRAGKIRAVGVSNFSPADMHRAIATLGDVPLASAQPPYSLLSRGIEAELLPWCLRHNVGVLVYSPMERGLLSGRMGPDRVFPSDDGRASDPRFSPERRRRVASALSSVADIAERHQTTFANLAVAWTLHQPGVTAALVGARNAAQAAENARAGQLTLSPHDVGRLGAAFADLQG